MASDSMSQIANLMKGLTSSSPTASPSAVTKGGRRRRHRKSSKSSGTRKHRRHRRGKKSNSKSNWFF